MTLLAKNNNLQTAAYRSNMLIKQICALCAVMIFFIIVADFIIPLIAAVSPILKNNVKNTGISYSNDKIFFRIARISIFTVVQAAVSTLIALCIGIPAAFFIAKRNFPGRKILSSLAAVPLCIPALIIALGYVSFFGMSGTLNRFLINFFNLKNAPVTFLYSFAGIVIAQGFYNFPLVMETVSDSWEQLPQDEADSARLLGASEPRIFRTITIFQLAPAAVSACIPVFLYCFFSFMIVLLFGSVGCTTLEVEIFQAARNSLNFREAGTLALIETLIACCCVSVYCALEQKSQKEDGISFISDNNERKKIKGLFEKIFFVATIAFIIIFFIAPLAGIVANALSAGTSGAQRYAKNSMENSKKLLFFTNFSFKSFTNLFKMKGFFSALTSTLATATTTGLLSVTTAFVYAVFLKNSESRESKIIFRVMPMIPMAVSSVVMGFGITMIVRRGTPMLLILSQTALTWPIAFRQIYASLSKIEKETIEASKIFSHNILDTIYSLYLPVAARSMISAFGFCLAVSAGDTTLPLVLAIPKFNTLALFAYQLAGSYRFHESCAAGTLLGLFCAIVFATANYIKDKHSMPIDCKRNLLNRWKNK